MKINGTCGRTAFYWKLGGGDGKRFWQPENWPLVGNGGRDCTWGRPVQGSWVKMIMDLLAVIICHYKTKILL